MTRHIRILLTFTITFIAILYSNKICCDCVSINLHRDAALLTGGFLIQAAGKTVADNVPAPHAGNADRDDVWFAERWVVDHYSSKYGPWSDNTRDIAALLPVLTAIPALIASDSPLETAAVHAAITAETLLFAGGLTNLAKGIVQRKRPYFFNPEEPIGRRGRRHAAQSFWSGHTVVAFASAVNAAVMFGEYHPDSRWVKPVWIGGLALATATGVFRVAAGQHFPTDVLAAAAVGSFAGWYIPRLHMHRGDEDRAWHAVFTGNGVAVVF